MENETQTTGEVTFVQREDERRQTREMRTLKREKTFRPGEKGYSDFVEAIKMAKYYNENRNQRR